MNDYEQANRARFATTGGKVGLCISLPSGPVFWSRGWRGCPGCGGDAKDGADLRAFTERANGVTRSGWRCGA